MFVMFGPFPMEVHRRCDFSDLVEGIVWYDHRRGYRFGCHADDLDLAKRYRVALAFAPGELCS